MKTEKNVLLEQIYQMYVEKVNACLQKTKLKFKLSENDKVFYAKFGAPHNERFGLLLMVQVGFPFINFTMVPDKKMHGDPKVYEHLNRINSIPPMGKFVLNDNSLFFSSAIEPSDDFSEDTILRTIDYMLCQIPMIYGFLELVEEYPNEVPPSEKYEDIINEKKRNIIEYLHSKRTSQTLD